MRFESMKPYDDDWNQSSELWEHQGRPLTVGDLVKELKDVDPGLQFEVVLYESGDLVTMSPVDLGYTGKGERPSGVSLLVIRKETGDP
jgi:hypothetical protein